MSPEPLADVKLFRFDPEGGEALRYQDYKAPYKGRSVLDVLRYIYENLDSTIAFRWACDDGACRSCVVSVNGKPAFACMKPAEKVMKIEPHPKFVLVKDLVVDFTRLKEA